MQSPSWFALPQNWIKIRVVIVNLSGRGDKDVNQVAEMLESESKFQIPDHQDIRNSGYFKKRSMMTYGTNWQKFRDLSRTGAKAFIPFIMAGDPDLETTIRLIPELERAGSHIIELGIPFSDPVADGPTIQRAGARALQHRYRFADYLQAVKTIRRIQ